MKTTWMVITLLASVAAAGTARASYGVIVCHQVNCGRVCTDDPFGSGCGDWQCDTECKEQDDGGANGPGGEPGPGGMGGGGGDPRPDPPPPPPAPTPQCGMCTPGDAPMMTLLEDPLQCTDTSDAGCMAFCRAIADQGRASCSATARNVGDSCRQTMLSDLGSYCTTIVNGGAPFDPSQLSSGDVNQFAPDVCSSRDWYVGLFFNIVADQACKQDVATAKTAAERSDCRDELMGGSGSYFDHYKVGIKLGVPGYGEIDAEVGGNTSGVDPIPGHSGNYYCLELQSSLQGGCLREQYCAERKCPETPDDHGNYQDGSTCVMDGSRARSGGGSQ